MRFVLVNHSETLNYICPTYRFTMPTDGAAEITITMPSAIHYFKRITAQATMENWGASQITTTGGTALNPATISRAALVCNAISRSFQVFSARARYSSR